MVTGELRAHRRSFVAVEEPGIVLEILAREGARVSLGDVLARLDSSRLEIQLEASERELVEAEAAIEESRALSGYWDKEVAAMEEAQSRGASNASELRNARAQRSVNSARVTRAETAVEVVRARSALLRKRIEDMTIRAPFDGVVVRRDSEVGAWLGEGDTLLELVGTGTLEAWLDVPQRLLGAISNGTFTVSVHSDATGLDAELAQPRVIPDVNRSTRSFQIVGELDNTAGEWFAGSSLIGYVPSGESGDMLTISRDGVLRNDMGAFVYVAREGADGGSTAMPVNIQPLYQIGTRLVIREGALQAGDLVITEGAERLFPTAAVVVVRAVGEERAAAESPANGVSRGGD